MSPPTTEPALPTSGPIHRAWRILGTGLSFALFGIVGLLAGFTIFPIAGLSSRDPNVARRRTQWLVHVWFRAFAGFMRLVGVVSHEIHGVEKLRRPGAIIIANHPTLIDVVLLIAHIPEVDCIVKRGVFENPFMKWPVTWARYICQDTPEQLVADCVASLRQGHSLMIFPESTRTVPGQPIKMMHGAARIALEANATVVPVTITCRPLTLTKGSPWYKVPPCRAHFTLTVGDPYPVPRSDPESGNLSAAARRLTHQWEQYFAARTGVPAAHPLAEPAGHPQYSR